MGTKSKRLIYLQELWDLNDAQMGDILGVSRSGYGNIKSDNDAGSLTLKHVQALLKSKDVNPLWILEGIGQPFVSLSDKSILMSKTILCPYVANAGNVIPTNEQWEDKSERVQVPGINVESVAFQVSGDSMEPMLHSGDHLVCVKLESVESIRDNSVYLIITTDGIYVKEIRRLPGQLVLISKNKIHTDIRVLSSEILAIYQPLCKITVFIDEASYHSDIMRIKDLLSAKFPGEI